MVAGQVTAEVQPRGEGQVFGLQEVPAEGERVTAKGTDVGIQVERPLRLDGNAKAQFAQGGQQVVTAAGELARRSSKMARVSGWKHARAACWAMLGALMYRF